MMPIFFHLESHLWIAYLFFFNGLLIHWLLRSVSSGYSSLTEPLEAQVLAAFFISIACNGLLLLVSDLFGLDFLLLRIILPVLSLCLLISCFYSFSLVEFQKVATCEIDFWRISLYAVVFIVLFYNGGLIERISDAWWHMSLANKIATQSSFTSEIAHLNGVSSRFYPPLWHGNIALANLLSMEPIPILWNSFTAWGAVLKVMAFFLLAFSLGKNRAIAILSALFFVMLPGVGDSYLRVSAWPSHIAYAATFCVFYVSFSILDTIAVKKSGTVAACFSGLAAQSANIWCGVFLLLIINFTHQAEILWFALALLFYFAGVSIHRVIARDPSMVLEPSRWTFAIAGRTLLVAALIAAIYFVFKNWNQIRLFSDVSIAFLLPVVFLVVIAYLQFVGSGARWLYNQSLAKALLSVVAVLLLLSIDFRHVLSLFNPELAYPKAQYAQLPLVAKGWLGDVLKLPGWHLQLRTGLLYSGVVAIPLSWLLAFHRPSRTSVFLASTASVAFLFCASPYLYHWLLATLNYHSPWRVTILIFHPIILAVAIHAAWLGLQGKE